VEIDAMFDFGLTPGSLPSVSRKHLGILPSLSIKDKGFPRRKEENSRAKSKKLNLGDLR
jgi:hypothetical protein